MERMGRGMTGDLKAKFRPVKQCNCLKQVQLTQNTHQPESGSPCLRVATCWTKAALQILFSQNQPRKLKQKSFKTITTGTDCPFSYKRNTNTNTNTFLVWRARGRAGHSSASRDSLNNPFPNPTRPLSLSGADAASAFRASQQAQGVLLHAGSLVLPGFQLGIKV